MIDFVFDFASLSSYLALGHTRRLIEEAEVDVAWLPMQAERRPLPELKPKPKPDETLDERHARIRTEYNARDLKRYADARRLKIVRDIDTSGIDATIAMRGCLWAAQHDKAQQYCQRVFDEFWQDKLDLDNEDAIHSLLDILGAPGFSSTNLATEHRRHNENLAAKGIFGTPTYLVAGQLFMGRQHIPMIRWLLAEQADGDEEG